MKKTEDVATTLGDGFILKEFERNGAQNIQCAIKDLGKVGPYDQCKLLVKAADKLHEEGLIKDKNQSVRLSYKGRDGNWVPFPSIWVNEQTAQQKESEELKAANAFLMGEMEKQRVMLEKLLEAQGIEAEVEATEAVAQRDF